MQKSMQKVIEIIAKKSPEDPNYTASDMLIFPNLSPDDLVAGMPPAVILTSEFGYNRKMAEEAGYLFESQDKLLEFGCIAGTFHNSYADFDLP